MTEEQIKGISSIGGLIVFIVILIWGFISTNSNSEEDFAGTYKVEKKEGYITPAFNLIIVEDGSVRAKIRESETYGSWLSYDGGIRILMDNDFEFVFGSGCLVLDPNTNRLYFSPEAYKQKHPNKYFNVKKIK